MRQGVKHGQKESERPVQGARHELSRNREEARHNATASGVRRKQCASKSAPSASQNLQTGGSGYAGFLESKKRDFIGAGIETTENVFHSSLFPFQKKLTQWALKKGRAALWADTGLGKSRMQVSWASRIPGQKLILAPLCVGQQTIGEAARIGVEVSKFGSGGEIEIVNYEQLHNVDPSKYTGVVLDESSILKSFDGKTRTRLIEMFRDTPHKLCCTATPAPNDSSELANHCEFLGIMSRAEMLATYFVHDDGNWRLKKHAKEAFYGWLASWGMFIRKPSDLGFANDGYELPALHIHEHVVGGDSPFSLQGTGIAGRLKARKASIDDRVAKVLDLAEDCGQFVAWCGLNTEQDLLAKELGAECVSVSGSDSPEVKEERIKKFLTGEVRGLVSKLSIVGFGLNMQNAATEFFVGIGDSFEQYYQGIRRCWRFGQKKEVNVHIVVSDAERGVVENVKRKEREHEAIAEGLIAAMRDAEMEEIGVTQKESAVYEREVRESENWKLYRGDCIEVMGELPEESIDLSIYSPPFSSLYTYSASDRDLGNSSSQEEFIKHFSFVTRELLRITKPGRLTCCHISQIASQKARDGVIGVIDFRGPMIQCFTENGWIFHGEACVNKNPQAQAIRTHAKGLLFVQLHKDSTWSRPALADFVLFFRKPGDNAVNVEPDVTNNEWIEWAHPVWNGIRETNTLNGRDARANDDERHICPLQLDLIERCVRLWSNKGETVFSPFAGIGSEGHEAVRLGRKFIGAELKKEYFDAAAKNLANVEKVQKLF